MKKKRILLIEPRGHIRHALRKEIEKYPDMVIVGVAKDLMRAYELCREREPNVLVIDGQLVDDKNKRFAYKMMTMHPMLIIGTAEHSIYEKLLLNDDDSSHFHTLIEMNNNDVNEAKVYIVGAILRYDKMETDIINGHKLRLSKTFVKDNQPLIAIGASTGGVGAIENVITKINVDMPPILMVQHMSKTFTKKMADRLCSLSRLKVIEAEHGDVLQKNVAYLAPGDRHMTIESFNGHYQICLDEGPLVHFQRPAVDRLFESIATVCAKDCIGILLTGMGRDGAEGLLKMREQGAYTIVQDKDSSVVFGMPKAAIDIGGACEVAPIDQIAQRLMELGRLKTNATQRRNMPSDAV